MTHVNIDAQGDYCFVWQLLSVPPKTELGLIGHRQSPPSCNKPDGSSLVINECTVKVPMSPIPILTSSLEVVMD